MRVIHIIKAVGIAGAERHLLILLSGLRARQIDARLLLLVEPDKPLDDYVQACEAQGIPVQRETIYTDVDFMLSRRLAHRLRELRPEIVHTHLWHADLFGIPAARLAGVRTIITSRHNDDLFRHRPHIRLANRTLWGIVSGGVAISDSIRRFAIDVEGAPPAKVTTIHYGLEHDSNSVDRPAARRAIRQELGLQEDDLLVGMVCRLIEQKGITYGIQAFARVAVDFPSAHLVIAGDGPLRDRLQQEARTLHVMDRVNFLGWRDDARKVMAALDVFLMPSLWEGFGLVMLEAMGQQLPVIGSSVSAIPEVVVDGETGLLVPPRDADSLAGALRTLFGDRPLRRHMGLMGEDRLETHFSAARMVEETAAYYQRLVR